MKHIFTIVLLFVAACVDPPSIAATEASSTGTTAAAATSGAPEPCSSGPAADGTTAEVFDDAATFVLPFEVLLENPMFCNIVSLGTTYEVRAWTVNVTVEDVYPGPGTSGVSHYAGDTYRCGDAAPATLRVTVHEPNWYVIGLVERQLEMRNEGVAVEEHFFCYYDDQAYSYAYEVTEDDYNDVTEIVIDDGQTWRERDCVTTCLGVGQGCE
jgi:hypothetical protein